MDTYQITYVLPVPWWPAHLDINKVLSAHGGEPATVVLCVNPKEQALFSPT